MTKHWSEFQYCNNPLKPSRFITNEVIIGNVPLGSKKPIRIQSMTNTSTLDTEKSVEQAIKIFDAGADYVRFTASSTKEAENLKNIRALLNKMGYKKPIIADVHFNPKAAEIAAKYVEKVRINPGNFLDKKKFETIEYSEAEYQEELAKLDEVFGRLLEICRTNKTAIRIGTNHGSLSDRIMSRYGDTSKGMVEATMEFLRIAQKRKFQNVVVSLKSSNTRVMVQAYRFMVHQMVKENMNFPLHLGVTEAGEGEDGRIKSAVGMGTLLLDGIGDTIRVSLTEAPEKEIPVAEKLLQIIPAHNEGISKISYTKFCKNPFQYNRRETNQVLKVGNNNLPVVLMDLRKRNEIFLEDLGISNKNGILKKTLISPDYIIVDKPIKEIEGLMNFIIPVENWKEQYDDKKGFSPLYNGMNSTITNLDKPHFLNLKSIEIDEIKKNDFSNNCMLIFTAESENKVGEIRKAIIHLNQQAIKNPVIINFNYSSPDFELFQLQSAAEAGSLFIDGLADGIFLENESCELDKLRKLSFTILQATRSRMVKTEYISCPSCGRTHFDIEKITAEIRKKTNHLSGLKIGIMGCIVNGPGEMADADYGYVGTAKGEITIYKQKEVIKRNIPFEEAVDELIAVIKQFGDWKEPD